MTEPVPEPAESAPTRRAVLDLLKRNGEQTVAQLGAALGVSGVAVRRHLEVLEHVGLVRQTTRAQGRGRPAHVYTLTELGHDLFPRNYHQLVAQLLEAATSELGPEAVERLFDHRQQELAELYASRTRGRPLPELASEVIDRFDTLGREDPHWLAAQFMKSQGIDRAAARLLLDSFEDVFMDWLGALTMPTLVVCGDKDEDNGSARELADKLPAATLAIVPGTHMSSVTQAELGEAIVGFLAGD